MAKNLVERISNPLYGNDIVIDFLPKSHQYKLGKERIPNVSTIVGMLGMDDRFHRWIVEKTTNVFRDIAPIGEILDEAHVDAIARQMMTESNRLRDQAARIGTIVHAALEEFIKDKISEAPEGIFSKYLVGDDLADASSINNAINSFFKWIKDKKIKWVASERLIYSRSLKYAGTLDALAVINGRPTLIDFKVSNHIYPKYFFQTAAYSFAIQEEMSYLNRLQRELPDGLKDLWYGVLEAGELDRIILRLDKNSGIIDPYRIPEKLFDRDIHSFLALRKLREEIQDINRTIESIKVSNQQGDVTSAGDSEVN